MEEKNNPVASMIDSAFDAEKPANSTADANSGPLPFQNDVLQCQLSKWYHVFSKLPSDQRRSNVTIATTLLEDIPSDFRDYFLSDGVRLPLDATNLSSCAPKEQDDDGWSSEEDDGYDENDSDFSNQPQQFHFPQLNQLMKDAIDKHGGAVVPKLNWSSPKDATWVNCGSMKCRTPGDVYLLLKSSDFCLHDVLLHSLKDDCVDFDGTTEPPLCLALRKWCNLHPNMEFRCFVRQHELLAISQRQHTQHYPHLMQDHPRIRDVLLDFFEETIRNRFADGTVSNYVVDLYLDKKDRVWILDFNPWSRSTDSLLFEWSELLTLDVEEDPHFRIVETNNQVRQDPLASYRAPIDTVDLASMTGGDSKAFEDFMKQCQKPSSSSS